MIAADTSSLVEFFSGGTGSDVEHLKEAMKLRVLFLPPPVLAELLSDPDLSNEVEKILLQFPTLETLPGFWHRAGKSRALILSKKKRARFADALITQYCLDHDIALITRDSDFDAFERSLKLKLVR